MITEMLASLTRRLQSAVARAVVIAVAPGGRERAKNLLWAAGRLADWAIPLGLELVPQVLLHPSVIERFTAHAPGLTGVTRRVLRTNLRFLARRVVPGLAPADAPLPREHAKHPYSPLRSPVIWRWRTRSPRQRGGCARPDWSASGPGPD